MPRDSANVSLLYEYLPQMQRPYRSPGTKLIGPRKTLIRVRSQGSAAQKAK